MDFAQCALEGLPAGPRPPMFSLCLLVFGSAGKGTRKHLCCKAPGILLTVHNKEDIQVHDHLCFHNISSFSVRLAKGDRKHLWWKGLGILLTFGADDKFSVRLGKGTDAFPEERSRPF